VAELNAFAANLAGLSAGRQGLIVAERTGLGIATVMARAGAIEVIAARVQEACGIDLIDRPMLSGTGCTRFAGSGPGAWLAISEGADPFWAETLADDLADIASVFDQSSGYAVLRLSGAQARPLLQAGAFLDLHADAFPIGSVAVTVIAHVGAILMRTGEETFDVAVFRSFASSFWHWLTITAAARGIGLSAAIDDVDMPIMRDH
jgi:sarcosine oxidase subunit gamma